MNKNKNTKSDVKRSVGAPAKPVKFPTGPFTLARLAAMNVKGKYHQCVLSLRTKVSDGLAAGEIICLKPKKQPKGAVGRPAPVYVLANEYDASKMVVWTPPTKPVRKSSKTAEVVVPAVTVPVIEVAPATMPVETTPAGAFEAADVPAELITTTPVTPVTPEIVPTPAPEAPTANTAEIVVPTVAETVVA